MADESFRFIWQRKYNNKWTNYSMEEHYVLNKAVKKYQKTVTLPSDDPLKKLVLNLEKMLQENVVSGFQQEVRCLIHHDHYIFWGWEEEGDFISYPARITFNLEVAYGRNMDKIEVFNKADYEIDLRNMTQRNMRTNYVRSICRKIITLVDKDANNFMQLHAYGVAGGKIVKEKIENTSLRYSDIMFDLPTRSTASGSSVDPVEDTQHENIVQALTAEVASLSNTSFSGRDPSVIPVDPACPEANNYHVYCEDNDVYKVTLNLTNLQENSNKYFIIELLKSRNENLYATWFHWGRTGYKGQNNLVKYGSNLAEAKAAFKNKFYDKTHNRFENRDNFIRVSTKYDLVLTDLTTDVSVFGIPEEESKLHEKVQDLLKIICDKKRLEDAAKEFSYDSIKTPLGKITPKQILDGYTALDDIARILRTQCSGKVLIDACNNFYTKIPHDFGRKSPPLLSSLEDVKGKLKMLEVLSNIALAMDLLNSPSGNENLLDKYYKSLECSLTPLDHSSEEFIALKHCLIGTHGPTHNTYTMELIDAFFCKKEKQESSFINHGNNKLLWHGSRLSNWIGILKKGLQIAPLEAPSTGYMFGKGIYFADVSSKSANYCLPTKKKNEGLLLLSEVSLGNSKTVHEAENILRLPAEYNSVLGVGKIRPEKFEATVLSSDAEVPTGPLHEDASDDFTLYYNEYVVYNVNQLKMKYILRVKFNF